MVKVYYCEKLGKTLNFLPTEVKYCCACAEGVGLKFDDASVLNKNIIENSKKKFLKDLSIGVKPKECFGCTELKEKEISVFSYLKNKFDLQKYDVKASHIIVNHYKQCDCNCVYCSQKILYPNILQKYEILPIIEQLYKSDMIENNLTVEFQGGNVSELKEFEPLMQEFEKHDCGEFYFLINGIKYIPTIERVSEKVKTYVCLSLDAGTIETFKKIKCVDAFEQTTANVRKLSENPNIRLKLKYIVIKDINDNIQEIEAFLKFAKSLPKLDSIMFEIDYRDTLIVDKDSAGVPEYYTQLFEYAQNYCLENNLPFWVSDYSKKFLK